MPDFDDVTIECASRICYLVSVGIHSDVIHAAVKRSTDGWDLLAHIGFIEDVLDLGCTISDPE